MSTLPFKQWIKFLPSGSTQKNIEECLIMDEAQMKKIVKNSQLKNEHTQNGASNCLKFSKDIS